jgi:murein DD-endopeptidase MepM/ murein hydrolase activator NlpD
MIKHILLLLITVFVLHIPATIAQRDYPKNYFRSPIDYTISLSGSFAELRNNHFHSGLDMRSGGVVGKPIYAIADGYVSRIKVSPYGYGLALYITHPNGYVSVYGHLDRYNSTIAKWVKNEQYRIESFAFDAMVDPIALPVKKGEVIGYMGNSGNSFGAHLHFEIRDEKTEHILNPLLFGLQVSDVTPPVIQALCIYPLDAFSSVNGKNKPLVVPLTGSGKLYKPLSKDSIRVSGNIGYAIKAYDTQSGSSGQNGLYTLSLLANADTVFSISFDEFAFDETRYINSYIDFERYLEKEERYQRCWVEPNNKLRMYKKLRNRGIITYTDSLKHAVSFLLTDAHHNLSALNLHVYSVPPPAQVIHAAAINNNAQAIFSFADTNRFERNDIKLMVPGDALYDSLFFEYRSERRGRFFAPCHYVHKTAIPLHREITLSLKADSIPDSLASKLLLVRIDTKGKLHAAGGNYSNGWVTGNSKQFGIFSILADIKPPVITPHNIAPNKNISAQKTISLKISDDLSGISSYRATINEKWILMEYDAKNNLLKYTIDEHMLPGKNDFSLTVTDDRGNASTYKCTLIR